MTWKITVRGTDLELRGYADIEFEQLAAFAEAMKPFGIVVASPAPPLTGCGACRKCEPGFQGMRVCSECGNKRCPHASDHENDCTHSNKPGQVGSIYGPPDLTKPFANGGLISGVGPQDDWVMSRDNVVYPDGTSRCVYTWVPPSVIPGEESTR